MQLFETTLTVPSDHGEEGLLKPLAAGVDKQLASTQAAIRVALLHESELARIDPDPQCFHRPMRYDMGLPSPVI